MAVINTALGPLDTGRLGFTLAHEHILVTSAGIQQVYPEFIERDATIARGTSELREAVESGVRTIVDVTTLDLGRDVGLLRDVSRASGVQIVCATGIWRDIPRVFWSAPPDTIAPLFMREIEEGIENTGIRAGIIKVATDSEGVTREGEVILRAAARAHRATGVPISTHTWAPKRVGEEQLRILEDEGVDPSRVYVGHSNDTTDLDYLLGLLRRGVWLGLDRYPGGRSPGTPNWEARTETLKALLDGGFERQLMLGHDREVTVTRGNQAAQAAGRVYNPDGYLFISRRVLPRLRELGVAAETIDRLMVDNPRRFFDPG